MAETMAPAACKCDIGAAIAGAFDPGVIAAFEQRVGDQRQAGLRRRHDQDLAGLGLDPAMNHEMPEQGFLQRWMVDGRSRRSGAFRAARRRQRLHTSCGNSRSSASPGWNGRGRPS
jgi:hypothetical protein